MSMALNSNDNGHVNAPGSEHSGEAEAEDRMEKLVAPQAAPRKLEIIYRNILIYSFGHASALYGLHLCFASAMWTTIVFNWILHALAIIGVTVDAHRLWSHRSYKAKMPLQIILIVLDSLAFQYFATNWVRDHQIHHRYAIPFKGSFCFILPIIIPMYFWGETLGNAWHVGMLRYIISLNVFFAVNSFAHLFGTKPYDKSIQPIQSPVVFFMSLGEGFHNYHHVYPWDYRAAELGNNWLNVITSFIDFFARIGWVYDLKTVAKEVAMAQK